MIYGATLIGGPVPNVDNLEWNSDDSDGDSMPLRHQKTDTLWWSIIIEKGVSKDLYNEMFKWCEENSLYQCALRYTEHWNGGDDGFITAFFRHPDDALNFKWSWI